ncbi:MAG: aspartate carbamoyltransferase regulatory subunit [Methanothrix sp.]|uniref:Aspartate carbamoyltransferase regulatory chain n=1 Tax=Methanothrix harundinacea TaxID=301375 RepID=A0A101FW67_9EURY|nr:MAG: Aspartate carbamoyltransferase regulatory chain [Methanothrix harundinacea]MDD2638863.1 aspartate carbamoyltransferase regulatory subunit [Methanothrix sp.]MDI9398151.1 aspartate carbamoyltransferase regulatory subunit [Euryarchaeota archaeon]KUK96790.1 MAG: Aspartate carbamoyltransferase regulatory chain [Methanothrix harundinacea]MDD3710189.1 aspartate carbamoyltransferase regulatory subunit [Methanothrix sp.]
MTETEMELRVTPIGNGTVIDHIPAGQALNVLKILGIDRTTEATISVLMNVSSLRSGKKDIVKVEDRELKEEEVNKISLIAPGATINIIRNRRVVEKYTVDMPDLIVGVLRCPNPSCISNTNEPIKSQLLVKSKNPVVLRCVYCEQPITENIADYLI